MHNDFTFIAIIVAFFALAGLLTVACDHIIGRDAIEPALDEEPTEEREAA